jgi:lantibiotic modifying enzyme
MNIDNIIMGKTKSYCSEIYDDVLDVLKKDKDILNEQSLFAGKWGALLYLFYYEQFCDSSQDNAVKYLQELYQKIDGNFDQNYTFCTGLSGPFWLLQHLNKHGFVALDIEHISADFISGAIAQSNYFIAIANFDFLHGSAGICNLLTDFAEREDVRSHLSFFVNNIMISSVTTENGQSFPFFYYHTEPASQQGIDAFSLAHGTCALQIVLMKIHQVGIEREKCERLIFKSMDFVLHHEKNGEAEGSLFPAYLDGKSGHSRVSWCYGDLNVAIALWQCGKYFDNELWQEKAIEILKYNTQRISNETSGVIDVCLCHGAAGNAAMYMRMWHETREPLFLDCANQWFAETQNMLQFSDDDATHGALVYQGKDLAWQYCWNLLEGSAGVGLALISQSTGSPLPWDEFMLLS